MIIFLFGTWGAGKSHVGDLIETACGLPHLEADLHFDRRMRAALHDRTFHQLDLGPFYRRVMVEMDAYRRRFPDFVVSQGVYAETYRQMIYQRYVPEVRFMLVRTRRQWLQKLRLWRRARGGNPITIEAFNYMARHWEPTSLPHRVVDNDWRLRNTLPPLLADLGLCRQERSG